MGMSILYILQDAHYKVQCYDPGRRRKVMMLNQLVETKSTLKEDSHKIIAALVVRKYRRVLYISLR